MLHQVKTIDFSPNTSDNLLQINELEKFIKRFNDFIKSDSYNIENLFFSVFPELQPFDDVIEIDVWVMSYDVVIAITPTTNDITIKELAKVFKKAGMICEYRHPLSEFSLSSIEVSLKMFLQYARYAEQKNINDKVTELREVAEQIPTQEDVDAVLNYLMNKGCGETRVEDLAMKGYFRFPEEDELDMDDDMPITSWR